MSSDLWDAFGGGKQVNNDDANRHAIASSETLVSSPNQSLEVVTHNLQSAALGSKPRTDRDSDGDSWSAVNQELEDAWSKSINTAARSNALDQSDPDNILDDDDFGDFEEAEPKQHDVVTVHLEVHRGEASKEYEAAKEPIKINADVDDDFGDFEEAEQEFAAPSHDLINVPSHHPVTSQTIDTMPGYGNDYQREAPPEIQAQVSYDPFADLEQLTAPSSNSVKPSQSRNNEPKQPSQSPKKQDRKAPLLEGFVMAEENPDPDEEWDDLTETKTKSSNNTEPKPLPPEKESQSKKISIPGTEPKPAAKLDSSSSTVLAPTNVPPPSILIPLISNIIQELPEEIGTILKSHEEYQGDKSAISRALDLLTALEDRMSVIKVAARVLAGRKLRWKRDAILSQSMRIGAAGRPGGMKLTGVDKAETQREDREAAEFMRMWRKHSGRVRGAVMKMPAQTDEKPVLPHVAESLPVRTLRERDGAITAPKCCVLCGLKRDERVDKVDMDIWDQFGEWWTEHWGHTECRVFWNSHEQFLQQR